MSNNDPIETIVRTRLKVAVYVAIILAIMAIVLSILSIIFLREATTELQEAKNALERVMPSLNLEDK